MKNKTYKNVSSTVYLSFGSNLKNRKKNISKALSDLSAKGIKTIKLSSFYETSPVGPDQRAFLNTAGIFKTKLRPGELLCELKKTEKKLGREKTFRWGPRIIDIDILFYADKKIKEKNLVIPHKEIQNRLFVLYPLNEIKPAFTHPVFRKRIKTLLKNAEQHFNDKVKKIESF